MSALSYSHLEREQPKRKPVDHTARWDQLRPIGNADAATRAEIERFCASKRIAFADLEALGARGYRDHDKGYCLAYGGSNGNGKVVAIKYRPIGGASSDSWTEKPSVWLRPIVIGDPTSLNWLIAEGETDAARLYGLAGDGYAILALPAGAGAFDPEWAHRIPRGARVGLCHDADKPGNDGADKAARIIGGRTFRIRPPIAGDWCDWDGNPPAFLELAHPAIPRYEFATYTEFASHAFPTAEPLLGEPGKVLLAVGSLLMVYGADGCGKSTWTIDGIVHLAAGENWLGIPVPRAARICIIENEGPPSLFQQKLRDKIAGWEGQDPTANLFVFTGPWGEFSFADPDARAALRDFCDQHHIELVAANPTLGLGVSASGRPDETQQFVDWLVECGLKRDRAFWLLHHENKAGQISGDWGRHPDTKVSLQRDGNHQRTKLDWAKTRWATIDPADKMVMLEWALDTQGYTVTELDTAGTSDNELDEQIAAYLTAHPAATTRNVQANVKGADKRISARLKAQFDSTPGPRGATLWLISAAAVNDRGGSGHAAPPQNGENARG
jgi:hypothetical protein